MPQPRASLSMTRLLTAAFPRSWGSQQPPSSASGTSTKVWGTEICMSSVCLTLVQALIHLSISWTVNIFLPQGKCYLTTLKSNPTWKNMKRPSCLQKLVTGKPPWPRQGMSFRGPLQLGQRFPMKEHREVATPG